MTLRLRALIAPMAIGILAIACGGSDEAKPSPEPAEEAAEEPAAAPPEPEPEPELVGDCDDHDPLRQPFFGDLHVHTARSFDANIYGVRGTPDDAYRFAKGEAIAFGPYAEDGSSARTGRLDRPLDFAGVTDHTLFLGATSLCRTPASEVYDSQGCKIFRGELPAPDPSMGTFGKIGGITVPGPQSSYVNPARSPEVCGEDGSRCLAAMDSAWQENQAVTERHQDPTRACRFTSLHAYEYAATPSLPQMHRNVVFRNATVPKSVISSIDVPNVLDFYRGLNASCADSGSDCEAISIPHNSNLSNGRMFAIDYRELPEEEQKELATLRGELETLVEVTQIKGDSECKNGMNDVIGAVDEFCDYEQTRTFLGNEFDDCDESTGSGAVGGAKCESRLDFVRYALIEGLREADRIGVNPYKMGMIGGTGTHNANPGDVDEGQYRGWLGIEDDTLEEQMSANSDVVQATSPIAHNPGGLVGVWAEENSRDSIFDALKRKETFSTSGPRMTARFFGGWGFEPSICIDPELVTKSYRRGTPMGGDLPKMPRSVREPSFVVFALRDPGTPEAPGAYLQRIQIVKGWVGDEGKFHQRIIDAAGGANGAAVDPETCEIRGPGRAELCGVWTDRSFDPYQRAFYYMRVLENPSCRWSHIQCNSLPEEEERPPACGDGMVPKTVQERLLTSPIWYTPPES